ncbi:hypothetical protein F4780DRAFT_772515 [Xylariomycetidae sp. FL0641]|nr:hypothetical protein F4780DRAFT_772515 [Xylariomycetidae sp. FL0641]
MEAPDTAGLEPAAAGKSDVGARQELDRPLDTAATSAEQPHGTKRPAEHDADMEDADAADAAETTTETETPKLSKNQQRKLKRQKRMEEKRLLRTEIRREKRHEKAQRKRQEREEEIAAAAAEGRKPVFESNARKQRIKPAPNVPVSVIVDCQFEKYMSEKETVSLCNQVTRCYSDNRAAPHPVHLFISSYGGLMQQRYENVVGNQHRHWKNIHFEQGDFAEAATKAKALMQGPQGGKAIELLQQAPEGDCITMGEPSSKRVRKTDVVPEPEAEDVDKSIVYLTADSPYTLDRLEPNTCYVVGGIIDKNREKGLCYKIAREKNVRTAKLPIGEFMVLHSRHVLATNHVVEIMLRWLETGDWGTAFMQVIPMRKGGKLKEGEDDDRENADNSRTDEIRDNEEEQEADDDVEVEVIQVDASKPDSDLDSSSSDDSPVQIEGENTKKVAATEEPAPEEGLQNNALGQQRWSAPPLAEEQTDAA